MTATLKTKQYSLPLALQNLPPAETLNQMIDNINFLQKVMDETLGVISNQCKLERNKIRSITQRVETCRRKSETIAKYPSKATTVFSQEEYPQKNQPRDEPLVTMIEAPTGPHRPKYKLLVKQRLVGPEYKDTLQLFHSITKKTAKTNEEKPEGLGKLPQWLTSVSDSLLFNNDKNPYVRYELRDILEGEEATEKKKEDTNLPDQPQPPTIGKKTSLMDHKAFDLRYEPHLDKVPEFQIGRVVPGLSGVALDVNFQLGTSSKRGIAPSAVQFGALPDLGALPDVTFVDDETSGPPPAPPKVATPPPPQQSQPQQSTVPTTAPTAHQIEDSAPKVAPAAPLTKKPAKEGGRAAMLDEIRQKKALKQVKKSEDKPRAPEKVGLMDHLKLKLAQRNKLMRGITENEIKAPNPEASSPRKAEDAKSYGDATAENDSLGLHKLTHMATMMNLEDENPSNRASDEWKD